MNVEFEELKKEIEVIKSRNRKVELDQAWETSTFRKVTIAILTYLFMIITMSIIGVANPIQSAIIPTCGFLLSTLSLRAVKTWWIEKKNAS